MLKTLVHLWVACEGFILDGPEEDILTMRCPSRQAVAQEVAAIGRRAEGVAVKLINGMWEADVILSGGKLKNRECGIYYEKPDSHYAKIGCIEWKKK